MSCCALFVPPSPYPCQVFLSILVLSCIGMCQQGWGKGGWWWWWRHGRVQHHHNCACATVQAWRVKKWGEECDGCICNWARTPEQACGWPHSYAAFCSCCNGGTFSSLPRGSFGNFSDLQNRTGTELQPANQLWSTAACNVAHGVVSWLLLLAPQMIVIALPQSYPQNLFWGADVAHHIIHRG